MSSEAKQRIALVTGGSRGIGKATAMRLAQEGCHVYINYASNEQAALEAVRECEMLGGGATPLRFNVACAEEVELAFKQIKNEKGGLDILINNAGVTANSLLLRTKVSEWDRVQEVNLRGAFLCAKEAAKLLLKSECGRIVNVSSVVAERGNPGQSAYVASKAGVIGLTKALALELAPRQITVNAVTPGFIDTDMTDSLSDDQKSTYLDSIPLGKFGSPEDIASAIAFLVSSESSYITGQVIGINGGMYM
jgi:3-oxoacyl-[acyl-carrier protein] reductase